MFNGIKVNSFSLGGFYVSKLYIKLDKKLIVKIDEVKMNRTSKVQTTKEDLQSILSKVPTILEYFQMIDIESLKVQGNHLKILYDNEMLYLDSKYLNLSSKYSVAGSTMQLDLYSLYLKEQEALFLGKLKLDYFKGIINFFGTYKYQHAEGRLNIEMNEEHIDFFVDTKTIENIKFLRSLFRLDPIAEAWMYDNVTGDMKLNHLYGRLETETFRPVMSHIKGEAVISNAKVSFNKKVAAADVDNIIVTFDKNRLSFELDNPSYKGISIDGSAVDIHNLTSLEEGRVDVRIVAKHKLDKNVLEILKAFNINLPLIQRTGKTDANLLLSIPYLGPMSTHGDFKVHNARVDIGTFSINTKFADVKLRNADVIIKSDRVKHKDMIDTKVDLTIDTKKLQAKGEFDLHHFFIEEDGYNLVSIKKYKLPVYMDLNKKVLLIFKPLGTTVAVKKDITTVELKELSRVYKYSDLLKDLKIKNGSLNLDIESAKKMSFNSKLRELDLPLSYNNQPIKTLDIEGKINEKGVFVNSVDKRLEIAILTNSKRPKITLNSVDIDYQSSQTTKKDSSEFDLDLNSVRLNIDETSVFAKKVKASLLKDRINFDGLVETDLMPFAKNGKSLYLYDIKGGYQDGLLQFKSKDGHLEVKLKGEDDFDIKLQGLDLLYNTKKSDGSSLKKVHIQANDSNIIINDKYRVLSDHYSLNVTPANETIFELRNKKASLYFKKDRFKKISLKAYNITDEMVNTFLNKELIKGGEISLLAVGQDEFLEGHVWLKENRILDLAILNNIITLVNTSPAIINPLLAIPALFDMVTNEGFNLNGYRVNKGDIDFSYNQRTKLLQLNTIKTKGNSVDINGVATIDLEASTVNSKLNMIFMKGYSSVVKKIPLLGYILLGEDKRIATQVDVTGSLESPKIETNVIKDSASIPIDVIKRIILSPAKVFESDEKAKQEEKQDQKRLERKKELDSSESKETK